jgi:NAD(P)-dependent dehydrogenase (short-subunit alcohol dehydrogenase family)
MNIAVVGANRGIGLEFCKQLSEKHKVYAFCRTASEELRALDVKCIEDTDVSNFSSLETAAKQLEGEKLDYLIHVAGILETQSLDDFDVEGIEKQFLVNSIGPILSAKAFLPYLNDSAKIALLTSRMGSIADNDSGGQYGYRMSKAALNAAGKSLSVDLKPKGISVLLLHPGYVKTDMTGHSGLIETPESVAGMWKIVTTKGIEQTGSFWHTNGEELPW